MPVKEKIKRISELFNHKGKRLDAEGRELPSDIPIEPPLGYTPGPTLIEQIQSMVRSERLRAEAEAAGFETFEESDDFDIPDDPLDPLTAYEADFSGGHVRDLMARQRAEEAAQASPLEEERPVTPKSPKAPVAPSKAKESVVSDAHVGESE